MCIQPEGAALFYTEMCTTGFFTLDVVVRFATTQHPRKLVCSIMTWIDIMSVLPFYIQVYGCSFIQKFTLIVRLCLIWTFELNLFFRIA